MTDSRAKMRAFVGGAPADAGDRYRALSPLERVTTAAPRTLLAHGGRDQLVPHGHMGLLAARLRAKGVPCETLFIPYAQHAFDFVVGGFSDQILEAEVLKFLARRIVSEMHEDRRSRRCCAGGGRWCAGCASKPLQDLDAGGAAESAIGVDRRGDGSRVDRRRRRTRARPTPWTCRSAGRRSFVVTSHAAGATAARRPSVRTCSR